MRFRFNELIETWDKGVERNIIFFADSGDAADVDSASYTSNSYMDISRSNIVYDR